MAARPPQAAALSRWTLPVRALHGERDELFPLAPVQSAVSQLRTAAVDADLEVLAGVSHYETHRFADPLSRLVDWIRRRCGVE